MENMERKIAELERRIEQLEKWRHGEQLRYEDCKPPKHRVEAIGKPLNEPWIPTVEP